MSPRWQAWFALGVIRFGLRPADFWALTLAEWLALAASLRANSASPPDRARLDALRAAYPDVKEQGDGA